MRQQGTNPVEKRRTESVKNILLLGALGSWAAFAITITVFMLPGQSQLGDSHYLILLLVNAIMAICLTIANFLARSKKLNLAIWLYIFTSEIIFITISFTVANLGIILAIMLLIIIGNLVLQSLNARAATIAITTGIIASLITLLIDIFSLNNLPLILEDWQIGIIIIASGLAILILGIELLTYYQFDNIRSQIIVTFVIISIVPLWTITIPQLIFISTSFQENAYKAISNSVKNTAKDFDATLTYLKDNNTSDAVLPIFIKFINTGNSGISDDDILEYFKTMKKRNSNILSYSLLNKNGKVLIDTRPDRVNTDESVAIDFQNAVQNQESSISDIRFNISINKHVFYISSPILNKNNVSGVLRVEINADLFQDIVKQTKNQDKSLTAIVVNQDGIILANSSSEKNIFKVIAPLKQDRLVALQKEHILSSGTSEELTLGLVDLQNNLGKNNGSNQIFRAKLNPNNEEANAVAYKNSINNKSWVVMVGQPITSFTEPANTQTRITILIATLLMLAALAVAITASYQLTWPVNYLIAASDKIKSGELDFSISLERRDEIGQLSKTFNAITLKLKETLTTIENKVDERTTDFATTTKSALQQADQLRSLVEITHTITSIQNINELLPEIAKQISTVFDFYHVGIYLTDQAGQHTILKATNNEDAQKMLEKNYHLKVGQTDSISFVTSSGQTHIALDIDPNVTVFNNPNLPNTRSEIIVPLRIGENIIGALDLQSNKNTIFSADTINTFNLLANQIAITIQNTQLFSETRSTLAEAQVLYRQSAAASWRNILHQGTRGYRYINGNIEPINEEAEKSIERKNTNNNPEQLVIPINIRGKSLGILKIHQTERKHSWSNSEIQIYKSIVDRISFALENARLYQDAQRRATKERVISEIANKVSSSVNMDNILQTAVDELGRVLPGSEIIIQFEHEDETSSEFRAQD